LVHAPAFTAGKEPVLGNRSERLPMPKYDHDMRGAVSADRTKGYARE
jgi:hypothetical protein